MAITDGLAPTEEQRDLARTLRDFLDDHLPSGALRAAMETEAGHDRPLWNRLAGELGLAGLTIAEEYGGLGLGPAEAALVHEELGRALYPGPFLATSLATAALLASGDDAAQRRYLPRIAAGECVAVLAAADRRGTWDVTGHSVRARTAGAGWRLTGARGFVLAGHVADVLLVPAAGPAGPALFLVEAGAPGLTARAVPGLDLTRRTATVAFEDTPAVMVGAEDGLDTILRAADRTRQLATAAEAAGGIGWCLDRSVEHAKNREQFGRPIGSFQAVAHQAVDMLAHRESARAAVRYAAVATAENDPEAPMATRVAVLRTGEAYRTTTEAAIHLFGGTGFTWEHDAHLYYRRAWSGRELAGSARDHREAIAGLAGL
ncbi:acyl-CoA dehydrogenase family protein [Streptomyces sp. NPDC026672]|uniref:acyl-CoA dehydrogenase family protein n=1 Tax=unclassified Streptomyces TaxID=2593676 RepID=UPI003410DDA9